MEHTETKLDYITENERLREINSELLEALEGIVTEHGRQPVCLLCDRRIACDKQCPILQARAAIKAAKRD